jgi:homopolymeric O-antigen transport system permease protein
MNVIPPKDPNLVWIKARHHNKIRLLDFDQFITELGHGIVAFFRYVGELWQRRTLIPVLAGRDLKGQYEMNIVGFGWWLLEPLSMTAVYYFLINILQGGKGSDPVRVLTILVATLPFKWFVQSLIGSMGVIRGNASLVNDVYLPRALLPLTQLAIGLAHFGVGLLVVPVFMILLHVTPTWHLLWLPVVIAVQFVFMLGIAYVFAVWGLTFRNLPNTMTQLLRLWFYLSPALYPITQVKGKLRLLMDFNPMTGLFQGYRGALLHSVRDLKTGALLNNGPDWTLIYTFVVGVILTVIGAWYFTRREAHFGKML